jgi:hypothetical protein
MQNLSNNDTDMITKNLNELFAFIYKRETKLSRKLDFDILHITYPKQKVYKLDIKYLKNIKKLLSQYFANIEKKPFTDKKYNSYAFEALWILLGILDRAHGYKYRQKELFANITMMQNIGNMMRFGRYIFRIPKYKQFIFDVEGYNMAKLTIL